MKIKSSAGELAAGIDVKGDGGYVIAAGIHQSGARYQSNAVPIAPAEAWLVDLVKERPAAKAAPSAVVPRASAETSDYGRAVVRAEAQTVASAPIGVGNETLYRAALKLGSLEAGGEIAPGNAQRALEHAADSWQHRDPCSEKTIESGLDNGRKNPRKAPEAETRTRR